MALGDRLGLRFSKYSAAAVSSGGEREEMAEDGRDLDDTNSLGGDTEASMADMIAKYLPSKVVLCDYRHQVEQGTPSNRQSVVPSWRIDAGMKTGYVALVLCLNIGVDPPDVIKVSPCARMECWIDPFSMAPSNALTSIGETLRAQYERLQPKGKALYQTRLDPTVDEVRRLCDTCRLNARTERVLFHYNGHGVPKPTANGEIWVFNRGYTEYIPLPISDLASWLKTPSIYVFDCPAAGMIVGAFLEVQDLNSPCTSASSINDCILLAACEAHESLPQGADLPADVFTSCLTTPVQMALRWLCSRSLLRDVLDPSLIDRIPGRLDDRTTLLGKLNWIFTALTDTIAWNILPHDLFPRLFRQDVLVASLFRNFLLAERIMRSANCSPISYPLLPPSHQHHLWDAWDMVAELCLQSWVKEPETEFQPSSFFNEQLTAFEIWLDHGSQHKKPPEQLPIVLWVLVTPCYRFRALILLGRFLDLGPWAVDLASSVGMFLYVLKLLQTSATELGQILVFIWTKILAFDKSWQTDLVNDRAHFYFMKFLDSNNAYPEQRAMATFVLTVIVDENKLGQEACMKSDLVHMCLRYLRPNDVQSEPLLHQWLCLCLAKLWEGNPVAQAMGLQAEAPKLFAQLLSDPQPEVRASATFAMGNLLDVGPALSVNGGEVNIDSQDDKKIKDEMDIIQNLLVVVTDGSPLVRLEVAVALARFAFRHKNYLKSAAAAAAVGEHCNTVPSLSPLSVNLGSLCRGSSGQIYKRHRGNCSTTMSQAQGSRISFSSPAMAGLMHDSPESEDSSQSSDSEIFHDHINQFLRCLRPKHLDGRIYCQCLVALYSLARDPAPSVAHLGKQILALVGIDQVSTNLLWNGGSSNLLGDIGKRFLTSNRTRLARSSSWFELSAGPLPIRFGNNSASPPMRKVFSVSNLQNLSELGFADPPLGSGGSSSVSERTLIPRSAIYSWSCSHFSKPFLTETDDDEDSSTRRQEREKFVLDCITKWQHISAVKLTREFGYWDTDFEACTKAALLEPFLPVCIAADDSQRIRVWNYKEDRVLNSFEYNICSAEDVCKLCLVNELDDSLLLIASRDGNVSIWKDYAQMDQQKLVTAFCSISRIGPGIQNVNAVVDWQQQSGYLYAAGEISSIMLWDMEKEQCMNSFPSSSNVGVSALSASQVHEAQLVAGFNDGSVRLYDIRTPEMVVCTAQPHTRGVDRVVGLNFRPGSDPLKIVSASQTGDIKFLDMRNYTDPYFSIKPYGGSLTAFAVHRHAPIIARGSAKQVIEVFNLEGDPISSIKYHQNLMAQRIGLVSCLSFHPYEGLLAAGTDDALLSIYGS